MLLQQRGALLLLLCYCAAAKTPLIYRLKHSHNPSSNNNNNNNNNNKNQLIANINPNADNNNNNNYNNNNGDGKSATGGGYHARMHSLAANNKADLEMYFPTKVSWWSKDDKSHGNVNVLPLVKQTKDTLLQDEAPSSYKPSLSYYNVPSTAGDVVPSLSREEHNQVINHMLLSDGSKSLPYATLINIQAKHLEAQHQKIEKEAAQQAYKMPKDTTKELPMHMRVLFSLRDDQLNGAEPLLLEDQEQPQTLPNVAYEPALPQRQQQQQQHQALEQTDDTDPFAPLIFDMAPNCPQGYKMVGKYCRKLADDI